MSKQPVDLQNGLARLPDARPAKGIADIPMMQHPLAAFASQMMRSGDSDYLFPRLRIDSSRPSIFPSTAATRRQPARAGFSWIDLQEPDSGPGEAANLPSNGLSGKDR